MKEKGLDKKDWSGDIIRSYQYLKFDDAIEKAERFIELGFYVKLMYSHSERLITGWSDRYVLDIYNEMK